MSIFKEAIYEQKKLNKPKPSNRIVGMKRNRVDVDSNMALITGKMHLLRLPAASEGILTPNKTNYNYQAASPYYVNVKCNRPAETPQKHTKNTNDMTGRRKNCSRTISVDKLIDEVIVISSDSDEEPAPPMVRTNLFELTEENLGRHLTLCPKENSESLINVWRDKIQKTRQRESMLPKDAAQFRSFIAEHITDTASSHSAQTVVEAAVPKAIDVPVSLDDSFVTAPDDTGDQVTAENGVALNADEMIVAEEKYEHIDAEHNIVIYETRTIARQSMISGDHDTSLESGTQKTETALPSDYDTDHLRQELRHYGDRPGPITKNTKRLYLKRLVRYKKRPQLLQVNANNRFLRSKYGFYSGHARSSSWRVMDLVFIM